jgi:hypothetical protein
MAKTSITHEGHKKLINISVGKSEKTKHFEYVYVNCDNNIKIYSRNAVCKCKLDSPGSG